LDFGCGAKPYKNLFQVEQYIGVDIRNKAHLHDKEPVDIYYDGNKLPFRDEQFDSVFSSEVFEHVFNLDEILLEIKRVVKKNGTVLFTVPFVWDEHEIPYDFGRYSEFGIRHVLRKAGFEVIKIQKDTHFIEVLFQLWNLYLYYKLTTKNKYVNIFLNILFISPFTMLGIIVSKILPKNFNLYHNNVILAKKN
jgi:SAM-dependent methyltransferase